MHSFHCARHPATCAGDMLRYHTPNGTATAEGPPCFKVAGASQTLMVLSSLADAIMAGLAGFQDTAFTVPVWPSSIIKQSPLSLCHRYIWQSSAPATTNLPPLPPKPLRRTKRPCLPPFAVYSMEGAGGRQVRGSGSPWSSAAARPLGLEASVLPRSHRCTV